ncbi:NHL domain-containing thioredoxin family protein [Stackebrandtia soli]|uniref:NHL domain-containing thioredoxin family protein n=1 Tax=Stackebrandtia soli TaxID=1892856 RepID=UPI0039E81508
MASQSRVRAPELAGAGWLNTGGARLGISDLRGKIVLLDFWTFCCINCLHVLDELRPLEDKYRDELVVIGVHSPKFTHERDARALAAAVERYGVDHPVVNDPDLSIWDAYAARAWPTLAVIDPNGYVVSTMAGEGHAQSLDRIVGDLVAKHRDDGTLVEGPGPHVAPKTADTLLRFPGKAIRLPGGTLMATDSARHRLVELDADGGSIVRVIGDGERGDRDGAPDVARFSEPQGLCVLPATVAARVGYELLVADTVNHRLRGVSLETGEVKTVAGTGRPWRSDVDFHAHDALATDLSSPWDLAWFDDRVVIAMAGVHQLWWFDPTTATTGVYCGTTVEGLRDGPVEEAFMAQPSGLAADGDRLWIVDSETSALRYIENERIHTVIGAGLFDFGHVDGPSAEALLQHPLGVAVTATGVVLIADTYNGALREYDPGTGEVSTLVTGLAEPSDIVPGETEPLVVESAAHRLVRPEIERRAVGGRRERVVRAATDIAPGKLTLRVVFEPANGEKFDDTFGPSTRLAVTADPPGLLADGAGDGTDLERELLIADGHEGGVLQIVAQAATCDSEAVNPACHLTRQDWGVPVRIVDGGPSTLTLMLRGAEPDDRGASND